MNSVHIENSTFHSTSGEMKEGAKEVFVALAQAMEENATANLKNAEALLQLARGLDNFGKCIGVNVEGDKHE